MDNAATTLIAHHRLALAAEGQHGVIGFDQLDSLGVTPRQLSQLADRGLVDRLAQQAYRLPGVPQSWRSDLTAGLFSLGPTAVVSHEAAAKLHEFDRFNREVLEFTVRRKRRGGDVVAGRVHTTQVLSLVDITEVDGLKVTTPARTIIDLAALRIKDVRLEAAIDSSIRLGLATLDEIVGRLGQLRGSGRSGVRRLDRLLMTSGGHSKLEREFLKLVHDYGLPVPVPQVVHCRDGRHIARVDFLFVEHRIVVEVSGGRGHSSAADRAKDAKRRNELQDMGRLVLEFTFEDVMDRPSYVIKTLHRAFKSRSTPV